MSLASHEYDYAVHYVFIYIYIYICMYVCMYVCYSSTPYTPHRVTRKGSLLENYAYIRMVIRGRGSQARNFAI